jgi:drug/metabolite transporter (DMT)-like permease
VRDPPATPRRGRRHPRPVPAALAGAITIAFSGILVRLAGVAPETAALYRCVYALPLLGALAWWERRRFGARPKRERALGALAGVFFAADLIFWHHAIADVGAGLATVLGNLQVVLVAFLAWALLGERPGNRTIAAVPLVVLGAVLISGLLEAAAFGDNPLRGTLFGVLTTIAYSGFLLVLRQTNTDLRRPGGPLFDATLVSALVTAPVVLAVGAGDVVPSWPAHGWLVLLAVSSQVLGWLLISVSLPRLPAALTSVLLLVQPVAAVILAAVLLGEDPSGLQLLGVATILAGVVLATARRGGFRPEPDQGTLGASPVPGTATPPGRPA